MTQITRQLKRRQQALATLSRTGNYAHTAFRHAASGWAKFLPGGTR